MQMRTRTSWPTKAGDLRKSARQYGRYLIGNASKNEFFSTAGGKLFGELKGRIFDWKATWNNPSDKYANREWRRRLLQKHCLDTSRAGRMSAWIEHETQPLPCRHCAQRGNQAEL